MFRVRIEATFAAAHFIREYHGKCENLHGHNYRVRVTVQGKELGRGGMLIDFSILKKTLREILQELDHHHLNELDFFRENEPSAENIAFYLHREMQASLPEVDICCVDVYETEVNRATYLPDSTE